MELVAMDEGLKTQPSWVILVLSIGLLSILNSSISFVKCLYITFFRSPKDLKSSYGSWALVTGATDGIGKAFAFQLTAHRGLNLILVGRNPAKLKRVSTEIQAQFPHTKIKIITADFSKDHQEKLSQVIEEAIEGLDVGVVVNNVGVTYPKATLFHEVEEEVLMNLIRVNVEGTSVVTSAVLPGMVKRKKGAIVNIGSGAGIAVPSHPLFAVYAATKAYVKAWSRSIHLEYKGFGIHVQYQVPLYVATNMAARVASVLRPSLFTPSPETYAKAAISCIGYESLCTPYWPHALQWFFARFLPESLLDSWRLSLGVARMKQCQSPQQNCIIQNHIYNY